MKLIAGIIVAVIGLLIAVLGILQIVPGVTQPGIVVLLLGGLISGLSFIPKPETDDALPRMSTAETLAAIFYSPMDVFQNLRRHPRWLVALLIMALMSSVFMNLFLYRLTPERVVNYSIDKTLEMPMLANNEEARKQVEAGRKDAIEQNKNPVLRVAQVATGFTGQVFWYAFLALVFFLFALAMGGKMNFWQAFSAAVYAGFPVAVVRFVLNSIILFTKDPIDIHPILGQSNLIQDNFGFLISPAANPVLYTLLSSIGLLAIYWLWLNATGLKNAGEKVTSSIAWTATISIYLLLILFGVIASWLFGGFFG